MVLLSLWLNIVIAPRSAISNALHSKISLLQSLQVWSHKPSQALVVAVVVPAAVLVVAVVVLVVAVVVVMAQVLVLNHVLAVVALAVVIAQAIISKPVRMALPIHVRHALLTHVLLVPLTHVRHVLQVHVLLNQSLAVNVGTLAAAKYDSP
jgi:hypothetical protein